MLSLRSYQRLKAVLKLKRCLTCCKKNYFSIDLSSNFCTFAFARNQIYLTYLALPSSSNYHNPTSFDRLNNFASRHSFWSVHGRQYSTIYDSFDEQPPSWLFVSDAVAGAYGSQVNLALDLERRLRSQEWLNAMRKNLEHRRINFHLNLLVSDFEKLTTLKQERHRLEKRRDELVNEIKRWRDAPQLPRKQFRDEVVKDLDKCKEALRDMMNDLWSVEERVMRMALRLPNDLHPTTPMKNSIVVDEITNEIVPSHNLNHVKIGKKFDLIKFSNVGPQAYYLKGELAQTSMKLSDIACDYFLDQDYRLMSGPEFFKTPILESCGRDVYNKQEVLTLKHSSRDIEPMTHLTGVSLMTFAGYVAKLCVGDSSLPLKLFSIGPHYKTANSQGLYGAAQTTKVAIFCCAPENDIETLYNEMVESVWNFLSSFGFSIRLMHCCASSLRREEKRRMQVEIWAPSLNRFLPISSVSDHGDYISRRQMSVHNQNHADIRHTKLLHMVSGTAVNLTTLLAVWMEHSDTHHNTFSLTDLPLVSKSATPDLS